VAKCGDCKGRGYHKPLRGLGTEECEKCGGTGDYQHKPSLGGKSVSLGSPPPGRPCSFCEKRPAVEYHHACPQQRIDAYLPGELAREAKADRRNGVPTCRPCHDAVEGNPELLRPGHLNPQFIAFLMKWDLFAAVPRHLSHLYVRKAA
jgi:RecJ-like exonuclease